MKALVWKGRMLILEEAHSNNGGVTIIRRTLNLVKGGHNMETSTIFGGAIKIIEERWH